MSGRKSIIKTVRTNRDTFPGKVEETFEQILEDSVMNKPLPIGNEDFKEIIEKGYYYVDKTLFIKELLDNGS